ncbi:polysaccharide deacetylase family protein [soil metagenome]
MRPAQTAGLSVVALAALQWLPAVTSIAPLRRAALPRLAGHGREDHVALTYDDGPHPVSTPLFLDLLQQHGQVATFFLLGAHVEENAALVRRMVDQGHELAVHGWDHRCLVARRPGGLSAELRRAVRVIEDVAGCTPRWYRPPYGVMTLEGLWAARQAHLTTILWSSWGRDWTKAATSTSIHHLVMRQLTPGGTVLLHDTDRTSSPHSWQATLAASASLLTAWDCAELTPGRLSDHW